MPDTGSPYNLPYPDLDDIPDIPSDFRALAEKVDEQLGTKAASQIDADVPANLVGLPTTGQPLAFFGSGRPDDVTGGLNIQAPVGSLFTCTDPGGTHNGVGNFGAAVWRKGTDWVVTEGESQYYSMGDRVWVRRLPSAVLFTTNLGNPTYSDTGLTGSHSKVDRIKTCATPGWSASYFTAMVRSPIRGTGGTHHIYIRALKDKFSVWIDEVNAPTIAFSCHDTFPTDEPWPTAAPSWGGWQTATRSVEELRELIETEADPEKLQELRDELAELTSTQPGDGGA